MGHIAREAVGVPFAEVTLESLAQGLIDDQGRLKDRASCAVFLERLTATYERRQGLLGDEFWCIILSRALAQLIDQVHQTDYRTPLILTAAGLFITTLQAFGQFIALVEEAKGRDGIRRSRPDRSLLE